MEWVETTGRTLAEAIDAALDELGVSEDDLEYQVVDEPRAGLLGRLGGREARIRARVKPVSREKPGDRRRERRGRGTRGPSASTTEAGAASAPDGPRPRDRPRGGPQRGDHPRRRRGGRTGEQAATTAGDEGAIVDQDVEVPIEEQAEAAEAFTRGLADAFGVQANVATRIDDDAIAVEVSGDGLGLLVGPRGATLGAIEELVRTVVQRQTGGHGARINVDVAGYRAKRREALVEFTRDLARQVLEDGREQALEPMSPADRKVVHDAVGELDGVTTGSEGEEPRRRVIIRRA